MRAVLLAVLMLLLVAACGGSAPPIDGRYVSTGMATATLAIVRDGDRYIVTLSGGSPRNAGAAAPADCYVRAVGTVRDGVLEAMFGSADTTTMTYSDAQALREGRQLRLALQKNMIEVTRADTDGYCGLGATFIGVYRRAS